MTKKKDKASWWYSYWFGFSVPYCSLCLLRFFFYGIFSFDMWCQIPRAPKFSIHSFNVAHFGLLDTVIDTVDSVAGLTDGLWCGIMLTCWTLQSLIAARIAINYHHRLEALVLLPMLNGFTYFVSQTDNFQHHYLLFLCLVVFGLIDWHNLHLFSTHGLGVPSVGWLGFRVRTVHRRVLHPIMVWPLRLLYVQVGVVYLFTIVTKVTDPAWTGNYLYTIVGPNLRRWVHGIATSIGVDETLLWWSQGWIVVVLEAALAFYLLTLPSRWFNNSPFLRFFMCCMGWLLHYVFDLSGLQVGKFSWYMCCLYIPLIPTEFLYFTLQAHINTLLSPCPSLQPPTPPTTPVKDQPGIPTMAPLSPASPSTPTSACGGSSSTITFTKVAITTVMGHMLGAAILSQIPYPALYKSMILWSSTALYGVLVFFNHKSQGFIHTLVVHLFCLVCLLFYRTAQPSSLAAVYEAQAGHLSRVGDMAGALKEYEALTKAFPDNAKALSELGFLYSSMRQHEKAALVHTKVLRHIDPNDLKALIGMTMYYSQSGRDQKACAYAQRAHSQAQAFLETSTCMGDECERLKDFALRFVLPQTERVVDAHSCK
eukprot:TRINITY_DN27626_c0_g1_i1.p1 TRINITY_DN27626_c0_g1~~TRINITY_DN27626_c0_g1_i1.p1  ORF type:complete len:594 (-),score=6.48 TRINITY_DN27626_c0_g1_i1:117-1898(-)